MLPRFRVSVFFIFMSLLIMSLRFMRLRFYIMSLRFYFGLIALAGLALLASGSGARAQERPAAPKTRSAATTVYLVRHAERDTAANQTDPALSAVGLVRAQALSQLLARRHPAALFTTDTRRTRATLVPLSAATQLTPQVYDAADPAALAGRIRQEYAGKTVVVVGHSNTLLPLIEALGGAPPVEEINENEYDYLFTVRLADGTLPTVAMRGYGPERKLAGGKALGRVLRVK